MNLGVQNHLQCGTTQVKENILQIIKADLMCKRKEHIFLLLKEIER